jgi:hypothetical protein
VLVVRIGKKTPEELSGVARVDFKFSVTAATQQYQAVTLTAADGPMGTHDYRIVLELLKLGDGRTFMHLTYSYSSGFVGRLAMQAYLATVGHGKLGFTVTGQSADGQPNYIGGLRGVVERNTMRYYLAIDSFLAAASLPVAQQTEGRLHSWFAATERYALQLHEVSQQDYMAMKHDEIARQQVLQ